MSLENVKKDEQTETNEKSKMAKKLDAAGWALFFIWIGIAFLAKFDTNISLLGVGVIILGIQVVRKYFNLEMEGFWIVIGLLFAAGGIWGLINVQISLGPIVLIITGVVILIFVFRKK
jgi:hypothetical protein